jgi:hypothetical protein
LARGEKYLLAVDTRLDDGTKYGTIVGMEKGLPKWEIQIPLAYNDGSEVPRAIRDQILDEIFVLSNRYQVAGAIDGAFRMSDGAKKVEKMLRIFLGVQDENVPDLEKMAAKFGAMLGQESLYLERTGGTMYFIPPLLPLTPVETTDDSEVLNARTKAAGGEDK